MISQDHYISTRFYPVREARKADTSYKETVPPDQGRLLTLTDTLDPKGRNVTGGSGITRGHSTAGVPYLYTDLVLKPLIHIIAYFKGDR